MSESDMNENKDQNIKNDNGESKSLLDETKKVEIASKKVEKPIPRRAKLTPLLGLNFRLSFAIFAGAFGSAFQHGYNTGVLNAPQDLITAWINGTYCFSTEPDDGSSTDSEIICTMDELEVTLIWSWIVSIYCIGGMIGGSMCGIIAGSLGRKGGLLANNVLVLLGGLCLLCAKWLNSWHILIVGRFIMGVNSGINAGIAPMYLSEIAPTALRGAVGTVYQLIITISILLSQVLGMNGLLGNDVGWPFLLGLTVVPGILQVILLPLCPESPKHLLLDKEDQERSNAALMWLRGRVDVHDEMDEFKAEAEAIQRLPKVTLTEMVKNSSLRQPLIIAIMMMLAQQLSGINAAIFFSTSIFKSAGLDTTAAQSATLGMGAVNVGMTFVSLVLIEKAGRKTLMIIGLTIMAITTTGLLISLLLVEKYPVLAYVAIAMVIGFIIGFATGPGSIPWFFVTELFAQSGRPIATSIAVVTNWSANFLVGLGFAPLQLAIGAYVFIIFIVMQIIFIIYVFLQVPETKNKTIEEITSKFK